MQIREECKINHKALTQLVLLRQGTVIAIEGQSLDLQCIVTGLRFKCGKCLRLFYSSPPKEPG